jgi:Fe-Mn family superoxide dismutase
MLLLSIPTFLAALSAAAAATIELPDLPYGYNALEPILREKTLRTHHLKHHAK